MRSARQVLAAGLALLALVNLAGAASLEQTRKLLLQSRNLPAIALNFAGLNNLSSQFAANVLFSRTGMAWGFDATGTYTTAPNNLFLNNATLSTQNVTTSAANYIISFYGTGSVVLTGTKSATINGTGANNQVYLAFAATAGTLTATVSGSVTNAVLAQVTYETSPRAGDQVITTSAAYYGPRLNSSGLLIEEARTNVLPQSSSLTNAAWSLQGVTSALVTSPDNTSNAVTLTSTAAGGFAQQYESLSGIATGATTNSIYMKAGTSAYMWFSLYDGAVACRVWVNTSTMAISATDAPCTSTITSTGTSGGFYRVTITKTTSTTPSYIAFGLSDASSGTGSTTGKTGTFWGPQIEIASFATSFVYTGASSVTRPADVAQATGPLLACVQGAAFTLAAEGQVASIASPQIVSNGTSILLGLNAGNGRSTQSATNLSTANAATINSTFRLVAGYGPSSRRLVLSGGTLVSDTTALSAHTAAYIGSGSSGTTGFMNGPLAKLACWNSQLSAPTETAFSQLGAPWQ